MVFDWVEVVEEGGETEVADSPGVLGGAL